MGEWNRKPISGTERVVSRWPHYVYGLFHGTRCFYVGGAYGNWHRMWEHGPGSGAKSHAKCWTQPVTRKILAIYPKNQVLFWERYWWRELIKRGHPVVNCEPGDTELAQKGRSPELRVKAAAIARAGISPECVKENGKRSRSKMPLELCLLSLKKGHLTMKSASIDPRKIGAAKVSLEQRRQNMTKCLAKLGKSVHSKLGQRVAASLTKEDRQRNYQIRMESTSSEQRSNWSKVAALKMWQPGGSRYEARKRNKGGPPEGPALGFGSTDPV